MLEGFSRKPKNGHVNPAQTETRKFLREKFDSAKWFINAIMQRRNTMLSVMQELVYFQEDFFIFGQGHLRPLILKDIADRLGMDISTISRVVKDKYVQCDFGVYPLKYFFSEGVMTDSGELVSNKEVQAILVNMVKEEDRIEPLSDQKMTDMLHAQGFQIARRTVTKYREHLGIPIARLRREIEVN